jgi:hypothetical protein
MVGPLGVFAAGPPAATIEVEDVNGVPPGGCWRQVRQRPPLKLETLMVGPLGVLPVGPGASTTEVEDIDDGSPGGARARDPGAQHLWSPPLRQGGEWMQKPRDKCSKSS